MIELFGVDVFLRCHDVNGKPYVSQHRAWDKDRFLASRQDDAAKVNSQQKEGEPRKASVEQITEQQFNQQRKTSK